MELPPCIPACDREQVGGVSLGQSLHPSGCVQLCSASVAENSEGQVQCAACCRPPTIRSVPAMPSLPRSPFGRRGRATAESAPERTEPRVEIVESPGLRWINIERPGALEQTWLEEHFEFHALDYEDIRSRNQRPKVDEYDDYLFIVLHFPPYDKTVSRLNAAEVDMFVGPDYLITLPNEPLQALSYLFERCRANEEFRDSIFSKGPGYLLYKIVDDGVDASFPMLAKMGNKLERIEEDIFEGQGGAEVVRDISNVKQEIINFRKIVRPQRTAFRDLERNKARYIAEDLDIYFEDIIDASERAWDLLENYKEVVEGLEATNESAIAHRTNETFRILTAISLVFLPLTLIASVFGMNVGVPGEQSNTAFWIIMAVMLAVVVAVAGFFRRRGWL